MSRHVLFIENKFPFKDNMDINQGEAKFQHLDPFVYDNEIGLYKDLEQRS